MAAPMFDEAHEHPATARMAHWMSTGLACIEKTLAKNAGRSLARSIGSVGRVSIHSGGSKSERRIPSKVRFKCFM